MNIVEQNNNQYTKERTEVEAYLMRIIQRFFDIKNNETQESIEAIVVESLTRLKRDFYHLKTLIFHFNGNTGHIRIDISTVDGEPAFEKKTAFNKDFGNTQLTVCEGNDPRLFDDRTPLYHVHNVADIDIYALLGNVGALKDDAHSHLNQSALDVVRYTGTSIKIDLIIIERALETINGFAETLKRDVLSIQSEKSTALQPLNDLFDLINANLKSAQALLSAADAWLDSAKQYVDNKAVLLKSYLNDFLHDGDETKYENANKSVYLLITDEIDLSTINTFSGMESNYHSNGIDTMVDYKTFTDISVSVPTGHKIAYIKAYLEYDKLEYYTGLDENGNISNLSKTSRRMTQLPMFHSDTTQKEPFIIGFEYTDNNSIRFTLNVLVKIPGVCKELCRLGNMIVFYTDGMAIHQHVEAALGSVLSFLNINGLSQSDKSIVLNKLDNLPSRSYQYLIDGKYKYIYDTDGNVIDEGWFDAKGDKILDDDIDWDLGIYEEYPGCYLMLNERNKVISIYVYNSLIERNALLSISPASISAYIKNPKIKYQVYCRKE